MISHGKDIKVFCGNANRPLAEEICRLMGTKLGEAEVKGFADGEVSVSLYETVRGSDVFVRFFQNFTEQKLTRKTAPHKQ